ncbi:MAG: RnfABCDGE type electron transport complex subunit D, partial [Lawsonibacter sp.]|nr:RnfABCDGE type electron transport complex subunit D [Lawsonibacter sp.]
VLSLVGGYDPVVQLLSGGVMLGAFFMATDYVTSPTTEKGKLVFGICLGVITCAIRFLGNMNEGVSFAILLMNLLTPYIEVNTRQDKLGIKKKEGAK